MTASELDDAVIEEARRICQEYAENGAADSVHALFFGALHNQSRFADVLALVTLDRFHEDDWAELVSECWFMAQQPLLNISEETWIEMFDRAGFFGRRPTEPVTLYRGCSEDDVSAFSWTRDVDQARRDAARTPDGIVWRLDDFDPEQILAVSIDDYVILPTGAKPVQHEERSVNASSTQLDASRFAAKAAAFRIEFPLEQTTGTN
ncbi:MAG: hypothetical protein ABJH68_04170 [Ilumatobacter sp.]|uniref:hypothetical protein n=1 Tax=Ilumatobacter sp. TaxID=1967498 RepID=UPI003297687A